MDKVDGKILMQLQQDAKQNTKQIANKIGLSVTPTYERIRKMERSGIIKSYVALLDRSKIEKEVVAYCQITLSKHQKSTVDSFERKMNSIPEIMECHHVSGNFDFLLKHYKVESNQIEYIFNTILWLDSRAIQQSQERIKREMDKIKSK